jgi:trans-2,3-dihydro-3-hydroxyanthranilate isomerase
MRYPFATLDVFTARRFTGNPLAVVFDADTIESARMQAVAREFGFPETVFVLKPKAAGNAAALRIFTPAMELQFAGHPTVGAALILKLRRGAEDPLVLEEKIGLIKCTVLTEGVDAGHASFVIPALPKEAGAPASNQAIALALGLSVDDIGFDGHQPVKWALGNSFTFIPMRDIDAVRRCRIVEPAWDAAFEGGGRSFAFIFSKQTEDAANNFHARMFAPRAGVPEDPATGSAAAAFAGFCAQSLSLPDGDHRFVTEQGYEMARPSRIELCVSMRQGTLLSASVGGPATIITEGKIEA